MVINPEFFKSSVKIIGVQCKKIFFKTLHVEVDLDMADIRFGRAIITAREHKSSNKYEGYQQWVSSAQLHLFSVLDDKINQSLIVHSTPFSF
jgi:hypothetical protein